MVRSFRDRTRKRLADPSLDRAEALLRQTKERGIWLLTPEDARYPSLLRGIPGLPLVLYGRGELPDLEMTPPLAVAGTRKISDYGRQATPADRGRACPWRGRGDRPGARSA